MITEGMFKNSVTNEVIELGNLKLKGGHIIGLEDGTKSGYYVEKHESGKMLLQEMQQERPGMLVVTLKAIIGENGWTEA